MRSSVVLPAPLRRAMVSRSRRSSLNETPRMSGVPAMSLARSEAMATATTPSLRPSRIRDGAVCRRARPGKACNERTSSGEETVSVRIPRSRGAISGLLLVVLGAWGALVPFIGPALNLTIGPDRTFDMTAGRFWLSLLPGVVVALGGLLALTSANRAGAVLGAQLALAGGIWFLVGPTLSHLWTDQTGALGQAGVPAGREARQTLEVLVYFYGIGAAITAIAGVALGRLSVRSVRDVEYAAAYAGDGDVVDRPRTGR